ncbi:MAG TPA: DUF4340 domain-containing protein, partial [Magnetospirillaceae bacterium]|nr:DUF4340 domain-containing protein [Magnetospirillaceae bacterium]
DEGTARRVRLLDKGGQAAADFRVGRYSPDGSHVHVRMEGDPRGYSVPAPVSTRLPETRRSWLDLRIFGESVPMEDIQGLRVSGLLRLSDGRVFSARYSILPTQGRAWQSEEVPDLDPAAAVRLVRTWMHAEAEDFSREGPAGRDGEGLRVDLELAGGTLRSLWIQAEPDSEGRHLAVMTGTGRYFRIAPWTMRELLKTPQDLATRVPDSRP